MYFFAHSLNITWFFYLILSQILNRRSALTKIKFLDGHTVHWVHILVCGERKIDCSGCNNRIVQVLSNAFLKKTSSASALSAIQLSLYPEDYIYYFRLRESVIIIEETRKKHCTLKWHIGELCGSWWLLVVNPAGS